jgi:hypothetical protein
MSGKDLAIALGRTGTGTYKIRICDDFLEKKPDATAEELIGHLRGSGVGEGTIQKAEALKSGKPVEEYLGAPPPEGRDAQEERIAQAVAKAVTSTIAEKKFEVESAAQARQAEAQRLKEESQEEKAAGARRRT